MKTTLTKSKPGKRGDAALTALRRLLESTDKSIRAMEELRQARIELARAVEGDDEK